MEYKDTQNENEQCQIYFWRGHAENCVKYFRPLLEALSQPRKSKLKNLIWQRKEKHQLTSLVPCFLICPSLKYCHAVALADSTAFDDLNQFFNWFLDFRTIAFRKSRVFARFRDFSFWPMNFFWKPLLQKFFLRCKFVSFWDIKFRFELIYEEFYLSRHILIFQCLSNKCPLPQEYSIHDIGF